MPDIFGGTQVPAWLQELTVPHEQGETGSILGTALGAGMLALQQDPTKTNDDGTHPLKGIKRGLAEARMNQSDPTWKVKEQSLEAGLVSKWAQAATEWQSLDASKRDMAVWTTQDLPAISKFQEELKTNPDAVPPVVQSGKGLQVINQLEKSQLALQRLKFQQDNAKLTLENQKTSLAFDQAVSAAPVGIAAAIDELPNQGWNLDRQGKRTTPSTVALRIYNDWATDNGKDPTKAFGYKVNAADAARVRAEEQRKTNAEKPSKTPRETAAIQNIKQINDWEQQAKDAEAAGDLETARDLRKNSSMLQEQLKGWGMTMGYDDQGRAIFSMGKGSQPTVATQTMAQGKMLQYENAAQQIDYLAKNLTAAHVGVAGKAGELLIDKSLEQLFPGSENKGRVQVRSTLTYLRDGLMREMADDRSGRFSAADREEVGKALPSSGVFESEADAKDRLERVRQILASRTKVYARSMNVPPPAWSLNEKDQAEIVKRYKDGVESKLDPNSAEFKKKGFLTKDEAVEALQRSE